MSPLVSVIIPVFNVKMYLKEALDSVIHQSYSNLEILVIDDGSTDGSGALCDYYKQDPRVRIVHQDNKGLSAARNTGLDIMTGDYISFLDSDDAYHLNYIEEMLNCIVQENADIVVSRYGIYHTVNELRLDKCCEVGPEVELGLYDRAEALRAIADRHINVSVWNKLYKRELWDIIRFPCGHNFEDVGVTYKIFDRCESVFVMNEILYCYRKHTGSITETISQESIQDKNLAFCEEVRFIASHIPSVFSEEQLTKTKQAHLKLLITHYALSRESALLRELENQLLKLGNEIEIKDLPFRERTAYTMVCTAPWVLKITYSFYLPLRIIIWKATGR